jgi:hypothetical protein
VPVEEFDHTEELSSGIDEGGVGIPSEVDGEFDDVEIRSVVGVTDVD